MVRKGDDSGPFSEATRLSPLQPHLPSQKVTKSTMAGPPKAHPGKPQQPAPTTRAFKAAHAPSRHSYLWHRLLSRGHHAQVRHAGFDRAVPGPASCRRRARGGPLWRQHARYRGMRGSWRRSLNQEGAQGELALRSSGEGVGRRAASLLLCFQQPCSAPPSSWRSLLSWHPLRVTFELPCATAANGELLLVQIADFSDIFTGRLISEIPKSLRSLCTSLLYLPALTSLDLSDNAFGGRSVEPMCVPSLALQQGNS